MKSRQEMLAEYVNKNYKEYRGVLVRKYRNIFGSHVFVIDEKGRQGKVRVGKWVYLDTPIGAKLTVGVLDGKLVNIRPGICKNTDG